MNTNPSQNISHKLNHRGISIPTFLYGTAWKEDQTQGLVKLALESGFLGIDTANQRRHYYEEGVGLAVQQALSEDKLQRSDLFLQTKFTYERGQDHRLPYDPKADYKTQVQQSFESSLEHLKTSYIDSYILHGPYSGRGLTEEDWEVWRAMEDLVKSGLVKLIGISNVQYDQLQALIAQAEIKPAFVQNRCYANTQWDVRIRKLCQAHNILYQGFSLLTANGRELNKPEVLQISQRRGCSLEQVVFRFALQVGMLPLTGTTNAVHMKEDLGVYVLELSKEEVAIIERCAF